MPTAPGRTDALFDRASAFLGVAASLAYAPVVALATVAAPDAPGAALGLISLVATPSVILGAPLVGAPLTASGDFTLPWLTLAGLPAATLAVCAPLARRGPSHGQSTGQPR